MSAAAPTHITVVYPVALLDAPQFGARALALLAAGEEVRTIALVDGFWHVQCANEQTGYLPAAVCAPLALAAPLATRVTQPVLLYSHPTPGTQLSAPWLVRPEEVLQVLGYEGQFMQVQRPNGQIGYVPTVLLSPGLLVAGQPTSTRQAVHLSQRPAPGGQFVTMGMVIEEEPLLLLGRDGRFALVQRDDGQLGYVPAALCGAAQTGALLNIGALDLGWLALGGGWCWLNWLALRAELQGLRLLDAALRPYVGLALLFGAAAALWFSPRKRLGRSFALGALLGYALLHLLSGGTLTLWR